ncbi:adenylyltransferase/cytidyltransferase family protein [Candidatus Microgenomates bacterium]|nr:adenylyltransferase/cytidyltransferase family protein [Candidatus Microgenomates bacterium]
MHNKIVKFTNLSSLIEKIKKRGKSIVLVGGCFDILHIGHLRFLTSAKKTADRLLVALEADEKVKDLKGPNRPIHSQKERAEILAALSDIDYVLMLPKFSGDRDYFNLVDIVRPEIVAVTKNDPALTKKKEQLKKIGGQLKIVTPRISTYSTSHLAKLLKID